MDETYIKMCKEAEEIQRVMDGLNKDELDFLWSDGYHVYIKFDDIDCCLERLKPPISENLSEFKIARQEDLQEIYMTQIECSSGSALFDFLEWFYLYYENENKIEDNFSITTMWLCFVMERLYGKKWNHLTESWEAIT